jgi:hypothetical protein
MTTASRGARRELVVKEIGPTPAPSEDIVALYHAAGGGTHA